MIRKYCLPAFLLAGLGLAAQGCARNLNDPCKWDGPIPKPKSEHYKNVALEIEYPSVCTSRDPAVVGAAPPRTLADPGNLEYWDLSLQEAMQIALANSEVIRDLGGRTLTAPTAVPTIMDPALQESNPINGVEAALSAFDAQLNSSAVWQKVDRPTGQQVAGLFPGISQQDIFTGSTQLFKTNATGGTTFLRNNTSYLQTNNPIAQFPSSWVTNMEAEFRQPLLQGRGLEFNRIAGPNAQPGLFQARGVLLARTNTDIALADFETAVRNFASDVENAYWDLYFAYRTLDAQLAGRDAALGTWRRVRDLAEFGARGGEADKEAQARNQYFQFQGLVENAYSGRAIGSTTTGGIAGGGAFSGAGGVLAREQNLRFLLGLAPNDGRIMRPTEEPSLAKVDFSWDGALNEALARRVELRRQRWVIKQNEFQLIAARNFLQPRLDAQALYRWYGFGDDLYDSAGNAPPFDNAVQNMFDGDFQEWQTGLTFSMPLGFRQAWAGVRNAELLVARNRAILETQELQIVHTLGSTFRELERAYRLAATNFNRRIAAMTEVNAVRAAVETGTSTLDVLLESQRDQADAEVAMYQSLVEYQLAIKNVHYEKGTLLEYDGVFLQEGPWPLKAYHDAAELSNRFRTRHLNYVFEIPDYFAGKFPQRTLSDPNRQIVEEVRGPTPATSNGTSPGVGPQGTLPPAGRNNPSGLPPIPTAPIPPLEGPGPNPPTGTNPVPSALPAGGGVPPGSAIPLDGPLPTPPGSASAPTTVPNLTRSIASPAPRVASRPERIPSAGTPTPAGRSQNVGFSRPSTHGPQADFEAAAAPLRLPAVNPFTAPADSVQPVSYAEPTDVVLPSGTPVYSGE